MHNTDTRPGEAERLGGARLALFALPALPAAALSFPIGAYLPPFYAGRLGVDLAVIGVVFMFARIWDIVTDPLMGVLTDRTKTRWGPRKPWLAASVPVLMVGTWLLFFPQPGAGIALLLVGLFITFLGYTMATITHLAWAADLGSSYDERSRLQGAVLLMSIAGLLTAMILPAIVESGTADPAEARVEALGAYVLVLVAPAIVISLLSTPSGSRSARTESGFGEAFRRLFARPEFRRLLIADFVQ